LHLSNKWCVASNARISNYDGKSFSEMIFRFTYLLGTSKSLLRISNAHRGMRGEGGWNRTTQAIKKTTC
jgi:hypothetical protein